LHTTTVDSSNNLVFTETDDHYTGTAIVAGLNISGTATVPATAVTTTTVSQNKTGTNSVDRVAFSALTAGQSITVGGLTFTSSAGTTAAQAATAFHNFIQTGASSTYGTFTGNSYATMAALYQSGVNGGDTVFSNGTAPTGSALYIKQKAVGTSNLAVSTGTSVENARAAIASLTTLINTVSSGQASLSASNAGLTATLSATQALKSGLQNTVDTIQNIDATAMQAKLQQLNNQQSIDYYLVSQMNTEAAAILSIFR
jgi:flagellin-like hook-associated protein FlgL